MAYANGIPLLFEVVDNGYGTPVPTGALHGITITANIPGGDWASGTVNLYTCPFYSEESADYAVMQYFDGTPVTFTGNGSVAIPEVQPGTYVIAELSGSLGTGGPLTVIMG